MSAAVIYLTELDLTRLENAAVRAGSHSLLAGLVDDLIARANVVPGDKIPADVVTMNSVVRVRTESGVAQQWTLVYRTRPTWPRPGSRCARRWARRCSAVARAMRCITLRRMAPRMPCGSTRSSFSPRRPASTPCDAWAGCRGRRGCRSWRRRRRRVAVSCAPFPALLNCLLSITLGGSAGRLLRRCARRMFRRHRARRRSGGASGPPRTALLPGRAGFGVLSGEKPAKMLNFSKIGLEKPGGIPTSEPSLYSVQS